MKRVRDDGQGGPKRPAGCVDVFFPSFFSFFAQLLLLPSRNDDDDDARSTLSPRCSSRPPLLCSVSFLTPPPRWSRSMGPAGRPVGGFGREEGASRAPQELDRRPCFFFSLRQQEGLGREREREREKQRLPLGTMLLLSTRLIGRAGLFSAPFPSSVWPLAPPGRSLSP